MREGELSVAIDGGRSGFLAAVEGLDESVAVQFGVILRDLLEEVLIELNGAGLTLALISNSMGGAENATIRSESRSECSDLVSGRSSPEVAYRTTLQQVAG